MSNASIFRVFFRTCSQHSQPNNTWDSMHLQQHLFPRPRLPAYHPKFVPQTSNQYLSTYLNVLIALGLQRKDT